MPWSIIIYKVGSSVQSLESNINMTNKNSHANSDATSRHEEKNGLLTGGIYTCTRDFFLATVPFLAGKGHQWRKNRVEHSTHMKKHSNIRLLDMSICSRAHGPSHQITWAGIHGPSPKIDMFWMVTLIKPWILTININDSKKFFFNQLSWWFSAVYQQL